MDRKKFYVTVFDKVGQAVYLEEWSDRRRKIIAYALNGFSVSYAAHIGKGVYELSEDQIILALVKMAEKYRKQNAV